jgi:hypothetical protein
MRRVTYIRLEDSRRVAAFEGVCITALEFCSKTSRVAIRRTTESGCSSCRLNDYSIRVDKSVRKVSESQSPKREVMKL